MLTKDMLLILFSEALNILKRVANESCCLCRDKCLSCDAKDLVKKIEKFKNE